jgi:hypothetical protein
VGKKIKLKPRTFLRQPESFGKAIKNFGVSARYSANAPKAILTKTTAFGERVKSDYNKVNTLKSKVGKVGVVKTVTGGSIYD